MPKNAPRQYTIRNIPDRVDRVLRKRAKVLGKSFNQVALEALADGTGEKLTLRHDLDFMIGSMSDAEAKKMEEEIQRQHRIDPEMWK